MEFPDAVLPLPVSDGPITLKGDDNVVVHLESARAVRISHVRERRLVRDPLGVVVETLDESRGMSDQMAWQHVAISLWPFTE